MKKILPLLLILNYTVATAQTFIGKVGIAVNSIKSITYANSDQVMLSYGYRFADYFEVKSTKIYYNPKDGSKKDLLSIYFTRELDKVQAISLILTKEEFAESVQLMKHYRFKSEDSKVWDNKGLKWYKSDYPIRFFTDQKHHTIMVFYLPNLQ